MVARKMRILRMDLPEFHFLDPVGTDICNGNQEVIYLHRGVLFRNAFIIINDITRQGIVILRFGDPQEVFFIQGPTTRSIE